MGNINSNKTEEDYQNSILSRFKINMNEIQQEEDIQVSFQTMR